jgi:hypothetical protein
MKYDYCSERVPRLVPICVFEGWRDATRLPHERFLYRWPWYKGVGWKIGNLVGRALRRSKKPSK